MDTVKDLQNDTGADVQNKKNSRNGGRVLRGIVVSDKMKDTVVVRVMRYTKHPKYGKYVRTHKKYKVHDAGNTAKIGDKVIISECRPISKDKRFKIMQSEYQNIIKDSPKAIEILISEI